MDPKLQQIRDFTDRAHGEQLRKYTPERYIVHPVRVMEICQKYTDDICILAAALMHDVLEDTDTGKQEILSFLKETIGMEKAERTLQLVIELTDVYEKKYYPKWNRIKRKEMEAERMGKISADAQTIKYADILDNCREIMIYDPGFGRRFIQECRQLVNKMKKGNKVLREIVKKKLG